MNPAATSQPQLALLLRRRLKALAHTARETARGWAIVKRGNPSPWTSTKEPPYVVTPAVTTDDLEL